MTFDFICISGSFVVLSVDHLNMNKTTNYIRIQVFWDVAGKTWDFINTALRISTLTQVFHYNALKDLYESAKV